MATTSPDNIRTPNDGDQYALVQDLGAMADSVQTALNKRGGMYIGTAAQRTAFSTAPNGTHWQDTDGPQYEWVRKAGVWRGVNSIGGQVTITPPSGGGKTTVTVPLPTGMFATAPIVVASPASVAPELCDVGATASTTQISVTLNRTNSVATPVNWIVVPT